MNKSLIAVTTAAAIAAGSVIAPAPAFAGSKGAAVAAGVIGGIAVGTMLGAAAASQPRYVAPAPAYGYGGPVYVAPQRMCITQQQVWSNKWQRWVIRDVQVPC